MDAVMALRALEREQVPFEVYRIVPLYTDQPHGLTAFRARRGRQFVHLGLSRTGPLRSTKPGLRTLASIT